MSYIVRDKQTLEFNVIKNYPRGDESKPIDGLEENLEIFKIIDVAPLFDINKQRLSIDGYLFTNEAYNEHIKIAKLNYIISDIPPDEIIKKLNNSLGNHLDSNYPFWEQNKHSGKGLRYISTLMQGGTPTQEESSYINSKVIVLADWARRCRDERDKREKNYLENNIFPSFEWEMRPETN